MSCAFQDIRDQVQAALQVGTTTAKWVDTYDGEDWNDEKFAQIRHRTARDGAGIYVRLPTVLPAQGWDPVRDRCEVYLHLLCCAAAVANRESAAQAAEALAWQCYRCLVDAGALPSFMRCRWMAPQFVTEHQSPNCTMMSLTLISVIDLAKYTDSVVLYLDGGTPTSTFDLPTDGSTP